jgi:hypothetical protein
LRINSNAHNAYALLALEEGGFSASCSHDYDWRGTGCVGFHSYMISCVATE